MPFPPEVIEEIKFYVYLYSDPDTQEIFYIGKGQGNRCFDHLYDVSENAKVEKIQALERQGKQPIIELLRYGLTDNEASLIEAAIIDVVGIKNLTNKVRGLHSKSYGRILVDDIILKYTAEDVNIDEAVMLITINKLYHSRISALELYEATRGVWKVGNRKNSVEYAFAVYQSVVKEVYKINKWHKAGTLKYEIIDHTNVNEYNKRWEFEGKIADEEIRKKYIGKSVKQHIPQGAQNPIKYVTGIKNHTNKVKRDNIISNAENVNIDEAAMLIKINKLYHSEISKLALYEATRGVWKVGYRRNNAEYAFAVYQSIVKEIYKINQWHKGGTLVYETREGGEVMEYLDKNKDAKRWEFEGVTADEEIRKKYIGKSVKQYTRKGNQNPIKYVNC